MHTEHPLIFMIFSVTLTERAQYWMQRRSPESFVVKLIERAPDPDRCELMQSNRPIVNVQMPNENRIRLFQWVLISG